MKRRPKARRAAPKKRRPSTAMLTASARAALRSVRQLRRQLLRRELVEINARVENAVAQMDAAAKSFEKARLKAESYDPLAQIQAVNARVNTAMQEIAALKGLFGGKQ